MVAFINPSITVEVGDIIIEAVVGRLLTATWTAVELLAAEYALSEITR